MLRSSTQQKRCAETAQVAKSNDDCKGATIKLTRSRQNVVSRCELLFFLLSCNMMQFNVFICCFITFLVQFLLFTCSPIFNDASSTHTRCQPLNLPLTSHRICNVLFSFKLDCKTRKLNQISENCYIILLVLFLFISVAFSSQCSFSRSGRGTF